MVLDIINRSKGRIFLVSAISALAGGGNIWLLVLLNRGMHDSGNGLREIGAFAGSLLLIVAINFVSQIMLSRLSAETFFRLREQLVQGVTRLSPQELEAIGRHRLYAALTKDVTAVHDLIIVLPTYVFNLTVILACLVYLATISAKLFLALTLFLALALAVAKLVIADRAKKKFEVRRSIEDDLFKCYEAMIDGNKEMKLNSNRNDQFVNQEVRGHGVRFRQATMAAELYWNMSNNWATAMIFSGLGGLLFLSSFAGLTGPAGKQLVATFILVVFYMVGPLTILMNSFRLIHAARVGVDSLNALCLDTSPAVHDAPVTRLEDFQSLSVRDLQFTYDDESGEREGFKVGPLDLDIHRGEIVYLVGGNGSGKTTAAKLLTGLYEKRAGTVLVNGAKAVDRNAYFQYFSAIFQDYYLFETLIPKGDSSIDPIEIRGWIDKLKLTGKVSVENGRLSTTKLSYGQRKRLALLVALFDRSDIYVFDEWAADQDYEFREFFYREFLPELKRLGKTSLVVSHDDRYFHLADQVVKFEGGTIVSISHNAALRDLAMEADVQVGA